MLRLQRMPPPKQESLLASAVAMPNFSPLHCTGMELPYAQCPSLVTGMPPLLSGHAAAPHTTPVQAVHAADPRTAAKRARLTPLTAWGGSPAAASHATGLPSLQLGPVAQSPTWRRHTGGWCPTLRCCGAMMVFGFARVPSQLCIASQAVMLCSHTCTGRQSYMHSGHLCLLFTAAEFEIACSCLPSPPHL